LWLDEDLTSFDEAVNWWLAGKMVSNDLRAQHVDYDRGIIAATGKQSLYQSLNQLPA